MKDKLCEREIELIKEWRAECEKRWTPFATPNAMNRREAIIYTICADQLEKLVGEVSDKSTVRGGPCPKGGNHEWGIDGMHSNQFCKKCFGTHPYYTKE